VKTNTQQTPSVLDL